MTLHVLQRDSGPAEVTIDISRQDDEPAFEQIRCPLCDWRPSASSRWVCGYSHDSPEPPFAACGTAWNTFSTRGRCPGCSHQWRWTSCLRCTGWSLHEDWYDDEPRGH